MLRDFFQFTAGMQVQIRCLEVLAERGVLSRDDVARAFVNAAEDVRSMADQLPEQERQLADRIALYVEGVAAPLLGHEPPPLGR